MNVWWRHRRAYKRQWQLKGVTLVKKRQCGVGEEPKWPGMWCVGLLRLATAHGSIFSDDINQRRHIGSGAVQSHHTSSSCHVNVCWFNRKCAETVVVLWWTVNAKLYPHPHVPSRILNSMKLLLNVGSSSLSHAGFSPTMVTAWLGSLTGQLTTCTVREWVDWLNYVWLGYDLFSC